MSSLKQVATIAPTQGSCVFFTVCATTTDQSTGINLTLEMRMPTCLVENDLTIARPTMLAPVPYRNLKSHAVYTRNSEGSGRLISHTINREIFVVKKCS